MKRGLLLAWTALVGCYQTPPIEAPTVWESEEHALGAQDAYDCLEAAGIVAPKLHPRVYLVTEGSCGGGALACTWEHNWEIWVEPDAHGRGMRQIIAHEMAHILLFYNDVPIPKHHSEYTDPCGFEPTEPAEE